MSDTPRTDALMSDYGGGYPHPMEAVDLARELERELQEARLEAVAYRDAWAVLWQATGRSYDPSKNNLPWEE